MTRGFNSCFQVLIGDEPEEGMENLMEVKIPEDVEQKLKEMDAKEQEEMEKGREEQLRAETGRSHTADQEGLER